MCWAHQGAHSIKLWTNRWHASWRRAYVPQLLKWAADRLVDEASACRVSEIVIHRRSFSLKFWWWCRNESGWCADVALNHGHGDMQGFESSSLPFAYVSGEPVWADRDKNQRTPMTRAVVSWCYDLAGRTLLAYLSSKTSASVMVVKYIVAIDVIRVRCPADAICVFCDCGLVGIAGQPTQDHILLWSWRGQMWHQFYDHGLPE